MWLIVMDQVAGVEPYELTDGVHVIGRGRTCDFVIREPTLSRHHARISVSSHGDSLLEDLGSKNGSFVNETRISRQPLPLKSLIRLGDVRLYLSATSSEICSESSDETKTRKGVHLKPVSGLPLTNMTPVQREVFDLLIAGGDENTIAAKTDRSFHTVHHHVQAIFRKLGVHSRNELLALVLSAKK